MADEQIPGTSREYTANRSKPKSSSTYGKSLSKSAGSSPRPFSPSRSKDKASRSKSKPSSIFHFSTSNVATKKSSSPVYASSFPKDALSDDTTIYTKDLQKTSTKHDRLLMGGLGHKRSSLRSLSSPEVIEYQRLVYSSMGTIENEPSNGGLVFYDQHSEPESEEDSKSENSEEESKSESSHSEALVPYRIHLVSLVLAIALFSSIVIVHFGPQNFIQNHENVIQDEDVIPECAKGEKTHFRILKSKCMKVSD